MQGRSPDQVHKAILNRRRSTIAHLFKTLFILVELLLINVSLIAAFYIIYDTEQATFRQSFSDYLSTLPLMMLFAVIYIDLFGMTHFFRKNRMDVISSSIQFTFLVIVTAASIAYFFKWFGFPRWVMMLGAAFILILTIAWSILALFISKIIYSQGKLLIIAVSKDDADRLYLKVRSELKNLHITYLGYTVIDRIHDVYSLIDRCTEVLISSQVSEADKSQLFLNCVNRDKTIYTVPQFSDLIYSKFRVVQFQDMPTFMIDSLGLTFQQRVFKRFFDVVFSFICLVLTAPLQLIVALAVKIDSKGPALYSQERITQDGEIYRVYKFRTMIDSAEEKFGAYQSSLDDPRVTRVGKFLRNSHLDEFPQFLNILRGDMSVVGPRSDRPTTVSQFEDNIPGYNQRLKVKSGLTGLAQISGKYNSDPEDKLRFDMMYIKNYSFLTDVKIIMQTIRTMLPSKNDFNVEEDSSENKEFLPSEYT
jgi:exopolysaccharide biosynthesis polyprenyl glycosylphosphotransferase